MKAKFVKNTTETVKRIPTIVISHFNGDYHNYYFELQVNGMFVSAKAYSGSDGEDVWFEYDSRNEKKVKTYADEIGTYLQHFLNNELCGAFDKPLSISGPIIINNIQYEILSFERKNGNKVIKFLANGASITLEELREKAGAHLKSEANSKFIDEAKTDILAFAQIMFSEDELPM